MKRVAIIITFLFIATGCRAQVPQEVLQKMQHIISLIKNGKADELSQLADYPLKRGNSLPDITTAKQFVANFPAIFDAEFKNKLLLFNDLDVLQRNGMYGLVGGGFDGDIWMDANGRIVALNNSSPAEQDFKSNTTNTIQSEIYPTVNTWTNNILICHSRSLLIRIDETPRGLRYVAWTKGHNMTYKPDLILFNGIHQGQGTQVGGTWTWKSGDWTYVIEDVEVAQQDSEPGYFLQLMNKGVLNSTVRMVQIK